MKISAGRIAAVGFTLTCGAVCGAFSAEATPSPPPPVGTSASSDAAPEATSSLLLLLQAKDEFKQGAWDEALADAARVLETQPDNLDALYIAGTSERLTNRIADAQRHLRALVEASPRFPLGHFELGFALFLEADQLERGGEGEHASAKFAESAGEFEKELERDPTHADSLMSRAIALARTGRFEDAVQAHEAWIASAPRRNTPVVSLAATCALAERPSEAMRALERLPDKSGPRVSAAALKVANVFAAKRSWGAAVPFLERAADGDSTSTGARALLTEGYARAGMPDDAARSLEVFLTMDPAPQEAERVGEAIKSSLGDGTSAPSVAGVEPPVALRIPSPRYPKGQESNVEIVVRVLTLVQKDGAVTDTVLVPNRIWKEVRESGFEAAAVDAIKSGRFAVGTQDGHRASLWLVVAVKFDGA